MKQTSRRLHQSLRHFGQWWWLEIHDSLPQTLARARGGDAPLMLRLADGQWVLSACDAEGRPSVARPFAAHESAALQAACAGRRVVASLGPQEVFCLQLPFAHPATPNTEAVEYALLVQAPLALEQMVFDWKKTAGGTPGQTLVKVAVCRRNDLAAFAAQLAAAGLTPEAIGFAESGAGALEFVFPQPRHARARGAAWKLASMPLMVLATALGTGALAHWQGQQIQQELTPLRTAVHTERTWQREAATVRTTVAALQPATQLASRTSTLNELARLLPATASLTEVRFDNAQLQLAGLAQDPAAAARALASSPLLKDVRLGSVSAPVTPGAGSGFEISARLAEGS